MVAEILQGNETVCRDLRAATLCCLGLQNVIRPLRRIADIGASVADALHKRCRLALYEGVSKCFRNHPDVKELYSYSLSSGSDVVRLFAKCGAKSRAPRKIARTQTQGVCGCA